jgi:hypothetical protein
MYTPVCTFCDEFRMFAHYIIMVFLKYLPSEINRIIFDFEGGATYKTKFSDTVLPSLRRACWARWRRRLLEFYGNRLDESKELLNHDEEYYSLEDYYSYRCRKKEFDSISTIIGFLERKYWNRMIMNPTDTLYIGLDGDDDSLDTFQMNHSFDGYILFWEDTKYFPDAVIISGNIVEEHVFELEYMKVGKLNYMWNNPYGNGYYYRVLYWENGMVMLQEFEDF